MLNVQVDTEEVRQLYLEKLEEKVKEIDKELVFWDTNELKRRTCLCWNTIQKEFFFHPEFPKYKVGNKWMFPAEDTKKFLLTWLREKGGVS
ncbi:group-specific protein [Bacillus sp. FJAT-45350]|uniref:group-specific protein n=1 Tax=Bacillus sp. FJAT-45350 TaxID=2011014 RepID=UPI000BB889A2|nr:group-specific protein [Bacillus sp. FJAT-45350]